jgi:type VI secretion system secreted protein VgrG
VAGHEPADFELWVGPFARRQLEVVSFRGREAVSKLFSFDVRVLARAGEDAIEASLVGLPATLVIPIDGEGPRLVQGVVASIRHEGGATAGRRRAFVLRLVPRLWLLKQRTTSRVFQELTVPEILARVVGLAGVPSAWKLTRTYAKRDYCLQFRESDFAFIARIAAEEGIFWYFEHPVDPSGGVLDETVVFLDAAASYPAITDHRGGTLHLHARDHQSSGQVRPDDVTLFALTQTLRPAGVRLRDYDFQRPMLELVAEASVDGVAAPSGGPEAAVSAAAVSAFVAAAGAAPSLVTGGLGIYEHRGEYDSPEVDPVRARTRLEQHRRRVLRAEGESTCRRLAPGYRFQLDVEAAPALTREYAVTAVRHEGHSPQHTTRSASSTGHQQTYANNFECLPADTPARPARPKRQIQNVLESAVVVGPRSEEIHTDLHGRIKIQFHWDQEGGLNEHSSCWIRVAQTWAGASFGAQFVPRIGMEVMVSFLGGDQDCPVVTGCVYNATHPAPFMLPARKTRSGIRTQSTPGGGGFNELSFEDAKSQEQIHLHAQRDLDEVVERNHTAEIKGDELLHVHGKQVCTVDGSRIEQVQGSVARAVARDERVQIDGNRTEVVTGNADLRVNGTLNTRVAQERREVTGRGDLVVGDDYTVRTRGSHTTIVGRDSAKRSYVLRVEGTAQLSSSGVLELDTEKGLTLKCGKSYLKITSDKIELVSPAISAQGDGGGISVAKDKVRVSAKGETLITSEKMLFKTPSASLSMKTDVQIDGKQILLNSPDKAKDPVPDTSPPPTKIQMKDQNGKPLANQRFVISLPDGSEYSGVLDKDGRMEMEFEGSGKITFPDLANPSGG